MRNIIVTIAAGIAIDYGDLTIPGIYDYARKCSADVWVITGPVFGDVMDATHQGPGTPSWWKLPLIQWFSKQDLYDSMAFIDADVVISGSAPSIFDFCDSEGFWAVRDMNDEREFREIQLWAERYYPHLHVGGKEGYYNTGVWVVDRITALKVGSEIAKEENIHGGWMEQHFLNLMVRQSAGFRDLPPAFNVPVPFQTKSLFGGVFYHLCGLAQNQKRDYILQIIEASRNNLSSI